MLGWFKAAVAWASCSKRLDDLIRIEAGTRSEWHRWGGLYPDLLVLKLIAVDLCLAPVRRWSRVNRNCSRPEVCFVEVTWTCCRRSVLVAAIWWSSSTARVGRFSARWITNGMVRRLDPSRV